MKQERNNGNEQRQSNSEKGGGKKAAVQYPAPAQRVLKKWKPDGEPGSDKEKIAHTAGTLISGHVDRAHTELENNDLTDASPAFAALYLLRLREFCQPKTKGQKKTMHPSTAAGYIIESKVTNRLDGTRGLNFQDTTLLSGTRPDVSIDLGDGDFGLVDITAQKSLGHIFDKKGNWGGHKSIPYVAEAWYPSMSFSGKAAALSPEQIKLAEEAAVRKKELAELMASETAKQKTDYFLAAQDDVSNRLAAAGRHAVKHLYGRPRDVAALNAVGVTIMDDETSVGKLTIDERNKLTTEMRPTTMTPVPGFSQSMTDKALRVIEYAIRATAHKKPRRFEYEKKKEKKKSRFGYRKKGRGLH